MTKHRPMDLPNDFPNLRAVLEEYGVALRNAYQDNLIASDRIATGTLLNSVEVRVDGPDGGAWSVVFSLSEWWRYVEDGTRPHWPPRDAILRWIQAKPVIPRPDDRGRLPTPESLAFLIGRKIAREGTGGTHDLERAEQALLGSYMPRIAEALRRDVTDEAMLYIVDAFREIHPEPVEL